MNSSRLRARQVPYNCCTASPAHSSHFCLGWAGCSDIMGSCCSCLNRDSIPDNHPTKFKVPPAPTLQPPAWPLGCGGGVAGRTRTVSPQRPELSAWEGPRPLPGVCQPRCRGAPRGSTSTLFQSSAACSSRFCLHLCACELAAELSPARGRHSILFVMAREAQNSPVTHVATVGAAPSARGQG